MGVPSISFSEVYKEDLLNKTKIATIFIGAEAASYQKGKEYLTFVSSEGEGNIFEAKHAEATGLIRIVESETKRVRDVTEIEAKTCGYDSITALKEALKTWYEADDDSIVTYVKWEWL